MQFLDKTIFYSIKENEDEFLNQTTTKKTSKKKRENNRQTMDHQNPTFNGFKVKISEKKFMINEKSALSTQVKVMFYNIVKNGEITFYYY